MKFGLHFHRLRIPKWDADYVDYNGLRRRIRLLSRPQGASDLAGVLSYFGENISSFGACRKTKLDAILQREAELRALFLPPSAVSAACIDIEAAHEVELEFIAHNYQVFLQDLRELRWFGVINHAAISKIFAKLAKQGHQSSCQPLQSRWLQVQMSQEKDQIQVQMRMEQFLASLGQITSKERNSACSLSIDNRLSHLFQIDVATRKDIYNALVRDDAPSLEKLLETDKILEIWQQGDPAHFLLELLSLAVIFHALSAAKLVTRCLSQGENTMRLLDAMHPNRNTYSSPSKNGSVEFRSLIVDYYSDILEKLASTDRIEALETDAQGRELMYYAAKQGLSDPCRDGIEHIVDSLSLHITTSLLLLQDDDNKTPLHYAVTSGRHSAFSLVRGALSKDVLDGNQVKELKTVLGNAVVFYIRAHEYGAARILLSCSPDVNYQTARGETALYCAAQAGNLDLVQLIAPSGMGDRFPGTLDIDSAETTAGWTPLMVACANGHADVAQWLLRCGADPAIADVLGWTALEHAIFRGHHAIAEFFDSPGPLLPLAGPAASVRLSRLKSRTSCAPGERLVVVNLGGTQGGKHEWPIHFTDYNLSDYSKFREYIPFELEMSAPGTGCPPKVVKLPVVEDQLFEPFLFKKKDREPLQISIKLFRLDSVGSRVLVSSGASVLDEAAASLGAHHDALVRELKVFMLDRETMEFSGTVLISYAVATPFPGLQQNDTSNYARGDGEDAHLVGHRGLGQNIASRSFLQLGENTITSFLSAAKLGATFIEFDVQVTRDREAVIYHDFSLSESGTDTPIHELTLAQYKHTSDLQEPQSMHMVEPLERVHSPISPRRKPRSWSSGEVSQSRASQLRDRLRYTVDFQTNGFKPNTRGHVIQDSLATLEELLVQLPEEIGFNVEIKYTRLHETLQAGVAPVALNLNIFVDVALEKIRKLAGSRRIIISSFTPEVCILLSVKQTAYPVMFIANAGKPPMADRELRVASLQSAVQFARRWNMAGVVLACETYLHCPRLVRFVKNAGLVCASYGLLNNEPQNARAQVDAGVDIIVADRVKLIAPHLRVDRTSH